MSCNYLSSGFQLPINIGQANPCRDMFVGQLSGNRYIAYIQRYQTPWLYAIDYTKNSASYNLANPQKFTNDILICILESPHRAEYSSKTIQGQGYAAMGRTGKLFDGKFYQKLYLHHSNIASKTYDIVLLNSVQFQCSNGCRPLCKKIRDHNWNCMINDNGVYDDLLQRIVALNPQYIINLCTKSYSNLQLILQTKLLSSGILHGINFTHGCHPSSWYDPKSIIN